MIHKQNENYLMENQNSVNLNTGEYYKNVQAY